MDAYKILSESELIRFRKMNTEEIIQKYADLKFILNEKEEQIKKLREQGNFFLEKWEYALKQYELLKLKFPDINNTEYKRTWSWVTKIVYVLKKINRPLLSSELIELMCPYEPVLSTSMNKAQAFSANLNKAVRYKRIMPHKLRGSRGNYYVLPEWIDNEGVLLSEYESKIYF